MSGNLYYTPGQTVTFWLEIRDGYGQVIDTGVLPVIDGIYLPNFTAEKEYPKNMTRFDVGLYYFQFVLPRLSHHHRWEKPECAKPDVIGTYFVDISYLSPITQVVVNDYRQIIVSAPFGQFGALSGGRATCQF
jgi:hypothetical protein